jgi:hypothetical protein
LGTEGGSGDTLAIEVSQDAEPLFDSDHVELLKSAVKMFLSGGGINRGLKILHKASWRHRES